MARMAATHVLLVGVGGVGSWTAECLIRTGIGHLTIVDGDVIAASNINRQLMALHSTVGLPKVTVLADRLRDINPEAEVIAHQLFFTAETAPQFDLNSYDYILDCIDRLDDKIALLVAATKSNATVLSSMGAGRKIDPMRVRVAELWKVRGCPLGKHLRKTMRRAHLTLSQPVQCVYSEELLDNACVADDNGNGTVAHVTAIFGCTLAGLLINDLIAKSQ